MSETSVQVEKITGLASGNTFCGVYSKRVELKGESVGTVVSCVLVEGNKDINASEVASEIFEIAVKKLQGLESGVLEALKSAVITSENFVSGDDVEMDFVHLFFFEGVSFIVRFGDKVKVMVFDPPKSLEIKFEAGSGPVHVGQTYLVATEDFLPLLDTSVFAKEDAEIDFRDVFDGLATQISDEKDQSMIGAAVANVKSSDIDDEEVGEGPEKDIEVNQEDAPSENSTLRQEKTLEVDNAKVSDDSAGDITDDSRSLGEVIKKESSGKIRNKLFGMLGSFPLPKRRNANLILKQRRNLAVVAVFIILILIGSAFFTIRQRSESGKIAIFDEHILAATSKYDEAVSLIDLNRSKAREVLIEAEDEVRLALEIFPDSQEGKKLASEISFKLEETDVSSDLDFSVLGDLGRSLNSLASSDGNLIATSSGQAYEVDISSGGFSDVAGLSGVNSAFVFDRKIFVVTNNKVLIVDFESGDETEISDSGGDDISVFLGNVYLLKDSKIDKYVPVEGGYVGPSDYLVESENFSSNARFAIDGSIWVTSGNNILKFTRGEKEDFNVSGVVGDLGSFGPFFTNSSLDNLYVIDRENAALLVIDKEGVYQKSHQSGEFSGATDIVVSEDEQEVYITTGSKILKADLN